MKIVALNVTDPTENPTSAVESTRVRGFDAEGVHADLLSLVTRIHLEAGPTAVARQLVDALARVVPDCALGVCIGADDTPIVEMSLPPGMADPGRDPTRLFPALNAELIVGLPGLADSTLHVGATSEDIAEDPAIRPVVERAASLIAFCIRTAISLKKARPISAELKDLRAQLIQAEKLASLGQIVAGVVHELANPVTSIVACTEFLLRRATAMPQDELEHLRRIGTAADRILKFSRDLVQYARPASEEPGAVAIHEVVSQALSFTAHELERHAIQFSVDYSGGAPALFGQAGPLTQVFVNLFTNSAHAMTGRGGRLLVRTRSAEDGSRLSIEVTDDGVGIPRETLERIFEPFFTTKEPGRGTGLGLSIVREIVEAHGGKVEAVSTPGEGTTFTLTLPVPTRG